MSDTLRVRADLLPATKYPFIAEKLTLLPNIQSCWIQQPNISPIYLPKLNSGTTVNPASAQTVTQQLLPNEAAAEVRLGAGTLFTQQEHPLRDLSALLKCPPERTPVSLPPMLEGSVVVTISARGYDHSRSRHRLRCPIVKVSGEFGYGYLVD